ncbi:MAG: aryl-sulfate sulfotransferase [Bacteroidota bacterium]
MLSTLLISGHLFGQEKTVGTFEVKEDVFDGFTLFSPIANHTVYLIDNCGRLVHHWETGQRPGNAVYLMPDGTLFRAGKLSNMTFHAGGGGGLIERFDWDNDLLWSFTYNSSDYRAHHDFQVLPNGNVLILAWEQIGKEEAIAAGRDSTLLSDDSLWPERIVEVAPLGPDSGQIVWQWRSWDHLIQDIDSSKQNYGEVAAHPEKIDLNYIRPGNDGADWLHANAIHYHAELDQIMLSVLYFDEIWIIDHGSTTAEAAGPKGDLLFRWGNPQTYRRGDSTHQQLFGQHNAHWIAPGLPDQGKILIFNNGNNRPDGSYSSVVKIDPTVRNGEYSREENGRFLPIDYHWEYMADPPESFYSRFISGAQQLPNGNILIDDGAHGTFFEINSDKEQVWKYVSPISIFGIATQGTPMVNPSGEGVNTVFRATKYSQSYPAFIGRDVLPGQPIELEPDSILCPTSDMPEIPEIPEPSTDIFPNPVIDKLTVLNRPGPFRLINHQGQLLLSGIISEQAELDLQGFSAGIYFLETQNGRMDKILVRHER